MLRQREFVAGQRFRMLIACANYSTATDTLVTVLICDEETCDEALRSAELTATQRSAEANFSPPALSISSQRRQAHFSLRAGRSAPAPSADDGSSHCQRGALSVVGAACPGHSRGQDRQGPLSAYTALVTPGNRQPQCEHCLRTPARTGVAGRPLGTGCLRCYRAPSTEPSEGAPLAWQSPPGAEGRERIKAPPVTCCNAKLVKPSPVNPSSNDSHCPQQPQPTAASVRPPPTASIPSSPTSIRMNPPPAGHSAPPSESVGSNDCRGLVQHPSGTPAPRRSGTQALRPSWRGSRRARAQLPEAERKEKKWLAALWYQRRIKARRSSERVHALHSLAETLVQMQACQLGGVAEFDELLLPADQYDPTYNWRY